ncbi:hypothetical protein [Caldanaerobacter subterraneus]|uniref:Uncharacterized protein n=1 Tax=Caldanaerobacter subterraneus TaxID=911092 RepID=A0A7Y2L8C3_9THEO|nr:hypothetical protein [Caldanaerobacter subterraneus]NNG67547.1 hypothetical protein [Caldanaerobacter subterraneus]
MRVSKSKADKEDNLVFIDNSKGKLRELNDYGVIRLLGAMIDLAISDLQSPIKKDREEALLFLRSEYLMDMCDILRLDLRYYIKNKAGKKLYDMVFVDYENKIKEAI